MRELFSSVGKYLDNGSCYYELLILSLLCNRLIIRQNRFYPFKDIYHPVDYNPVQHNTFKRYFYRSTRRRNQFSYPRILMVACMVTHKAAQLIFLFLPSSPSPLEKRRLLELSLTEFPGLIFIVTRSSIHPNTISIEFHPWFLTLRGNHDAWRSNFPPRLSPVAQQLAAWAGNFFHRFSIHQTFSKRWFLLGNKISAWKREETGYRWKAKARLSCRPRDVISRSVNKMAATTTGHGVIIWQKNSQRSRLLRRAAYGRFGKPRLFVYLFTSLF